MLKTCDHWSDSGEGLFELFYLRDKEKREIDFLITHEGRPFLPVEVKWQEATPSPHWPKFLEQLRLKRGVQLVEHWLAKSGWHAGCRGRHQSADGIASFSIHKVDGFEILVVSADQVLSHFY